MSQRLIDAAKLIEHCLDAVSKLEDRGDITAAYAIKIYVLWYLVDAEPVDTVPVVRCKDCEHLHRWMVNYNGEIRFICKARYGNPSVKLDDFCSHGERKEGADNG